jgi:hypothetical protein
MGGNRYLRRDRGYPAGERDNADAYEAERKHQVQDGVTNEDRDQVSTFQSGGTSMVRDVIEHCRQTAITDERLRRAGHANSQRAGLQPCLGKDG